MSGKIICKILGEGVNKDGGTRQSFVWLIAVTAYEETN